MSSLNRATDRHAVPTFPRILTTLRFPGQPDNVSDTVVGAVIGDAARTRHHSDVCRTREEIILPE